MKTINKSDISAVILAGGQAKRMNGKDKGLVLFNGKPLISYTVKAIHADVKSIWVSANKNLDLYQKYGNVVTDNLAGFQGPLAGISAVLSKINTQYLLIVPCDGPYVDNILIERLAHEMSKNNTNLCVAKENNHIHSTFSLIKTSIKPVLDKYLASGERRLGQFFRDNQALEVDFSEHKKMFFNVNYPQDLIK